MVQKPQSHSVYVRELKKPLMKNVCLFEAGQGKNVNGNMFALVRELCRDKGFNEFRPVFVVREETQEAASKLFSTYGIDCEFVERDTDLYNSYLARAEYLFTDNSFPVYMNKRDDQYYVNTWHGTPLKVLGHKNIQNSIISMANVQKNYLAADLALFPNEHTRRVFWNDYKIGPLCGGKYVLADYPRNDVLTDDSIAESVRAAEHLEGKRIIAYMPTWRGTGRVADSDMQNEQTMRILSRIDKQLAEDELLYVNLHFLIADAIDYSKFEKVRPFPKDFETYDFLAACDVLVTDYSSVFFDFAVTGKPIVLYAYDKDEYVENVGMYLRYEDLPFPIATDVDGLLDALHEEAPDEGYREFRQEFCAYHTGHASADLLGTVLKHDDLLDLHTNDEQKPVALEYTGSVAREAVASAAMNAFLEDKRPNKVLVIPSKPYKKVIAILEQLPDDAAYLLLPSSQRMPSLKGIDDASDRFALVNALTRARRRERYLQDAKKVFHGIDIQSIVLLNAQNTYATKMLSVIPCEEKVALLRDLEFRTVRTDRQLEAILEDFSVQDTETALSDDLAEDALAKVYSGTFSAWLLTRLYGGGDDAVTAHGLMGLTLPATHDASRLSIGFPTGKRVGSVRALGRIGKRMLASYKVRVPKSMLNGLPMNNNLYVWYDGGSLAGKARVRFNVRDLRRSHRRFGKVYTYEDLGLAAYLHQSAKNTATVTVRPMNVTDSPKERLKITLAHLLATPKPLRKDIMLYEKECSRYEESASVVYERLRDEGYDNAWFVLDERYPHWDEIDERYLDHIVKRFSFKHYRLFFSCKSFVSSETIGHAMERYPSSRQVSTRNNDKDINYVFLQHGVMYMVSLDSESRKMFRPMRLNGKYRVVVSSVLEKQHFVDLGKYNPEMLYISGLPKFDRNTHATDADKIVIMPTWRPWEYNLAQQNFEDTSYYKLLSDMANAVPEELKDKLIILAHPLIASVARASNNDLSSYMVDENVRYGDVLHETKLLLTDYSSIAYDAFYRGASVIFGWRDKDACMAEYGPTTKLMLDEDTAFGDVCYTEDELRESVVRGYENPQSAEYLKRYRKIVKYHDGNNTDRLIAMMKKDHVI